jgi:hypothetical protein
MLKSVLNLGAVIALGVLASCNQKTTTSVTTSPTPAKDERKWSHELYLIANAKEAIQSSDEATLFYKAADEMGRRALIRRYEPDASFDYIQTVGPLDDYPTSKPE